MKTITEKALYEHLANLYDMSVDDWWPADSQYERILSSILVQNTTWENAQKSLDRLKAATSLDPLIIKNMSRDDLIDLIRPSGFYQNKSKGVQAVTQWFLDHEFNYPAIVNQYGNELRKTMMQLPNVGPETADTYLLYIFNQKTFIADAYAQKLYRALGLVEASNYQKLKNMAQLDDFTVAEAQHFHALIVEFGKHYLRGKGKFDQSSLANFKLVR